MSRRDGLAEAPAPEWSDEHGGHWTATRHATCQAVAVTPEVFSSAHSVHIPASELYRRGIQIFALEADGTRHRAERSVLRAVVGDSPRSVPVDLVRALAARLVGALDFSGPVDLVPGLAHRLPLDVVFAVIGGDDEFKAEMKAHVDTLSYSRDVEAAVAAAARVQEVAATMLDRRRIHPHDDWVTWLTTAELDGVALSEDQQVAAVVSLITGGHHSTVRGLTSLLARLMCEPGLLDAVRSDPARLDRVVDETLRLHTPLPSFSRQATENTVVGGCPVTAGQGVLMRYDLANRDPDRFPDPDTFSTERDLRHSLAFGAGPHRCVGVHLAKAELRIAVEELLRVAPDVRLAAEPTWVGPAEAGSVVVTSEIAAGRVAS